MNKYITDESTDTALFTCDLLKVVYLKDLQMYRYETDLSS